jgi:hypothetical protein
MGYFSNGTEGEIYYEEFCSKCLHEHNRQCAVWLAHYIKNYDECNKKDSILHMLIPREGIENGKCLMFVDKQLLSNLALQQYASESLSNADSATRSS